jgi:hypothetical protein
MCSFGCRGSNLDQCISFCACAFGRITATRFSIYLIVIILLTRLCYYMDRSRNSIDVAYLLENLPYYKVTIAIVELSSAFVKKYIISLKAKMDILAKFICPKMKLKKLIKKCNYLIIMIKIVCYVIFYAYFLFIYFFFS